MSVCKLFKYPYFIFLCAVKRSVSSVVNIISCRLRLSFLFKTEKRLTTEGAENTEEEIKETQLVNASV